MNSERLRVLRRLHAQRTGGRSGRDVAYLLYVAVLLGSLLVYPLLRAVVVFLSRPAGLAALTSAGPVVVALGIALLAGMLWLGTLRGPVTVQPFFVLLLATTDLPRSASLGRPFLLGTGAVVGVLTAVAAVFAGVLVGNGVAPLARGLVLIVAAALLALLAAVLWLAGQALRGLPVTVAATALLTSAGLGLLAAGRAPWSWAEPLWPVVASSPTPALLTLAVAAVVALGCVPRLLGSLTSAGLLDGAQRWQAATTAALSGDAAGAVGSLRARPTVGRRWSAVAASGEAARYLRSDVVALLRTPGRFVVGTLASVAASASTALSTSVDPSIVWLPAAAGAVLGFLAAGVFTDGWRHAAQTAAAPALYGHSTARLYLLHAQLPVTLTAAGAVLGSGVAVALGASAGTAAAGTALVLPLLLLVRAYDSAKGDLPLILLTPVPTPGGDASALFVLAWQADALLLSGLAGAAVLTAAGDGTVVEALGLAAGLALAVLLLIRRRLRSLG